MTDEPILTIYVMRDGDGYMAQCVEYDICAQAADMDNLFTRMTALVNAEKAESLVRTGEIFGGIPPAPAFFADMAARVKTPLHADGFEYKIAA